jgi:enoyl-CoA hydratase/carnithine racemase
MKMSDTVNDILVHVEAGVSTVTFNRLDKKNSITSAMYAALADALQQADADPAVNVLVFQGHATIFSAGNDIADFRDRPPGGEGSPVFRFLSGIANFSKPLIASVCGPAVGVGTTMLLHCDLVYAGDNAAFSLPFVNLGLCPEAASSLLLPQMLGYHRAAEALLLGEPFMAEAALEVGLVNRVLPPFEANAYAQAQARKLAAKPIGSLVETKRLMKQGQAAQVARQMGEEGTVFRRLLGEPAAREALNAFMERRKPDFSKL